MSTLVYLVVGIKIVVLGIILLVYGTKMDLPWFVLGGIAEFFIAVVVLGFARDEYREREVINAQK